jgi:hypothetical protein
MIAVKRATILLRFDWLTGFDRSVAVVTLKRRMRASGLALPGFCPGGAEVVRRMASQ